MISQNSSIGLLQQVEKWSTLYTYKHTVCKFESIHDRELVYLIFMLHSVFFFSLSIILLSITDLE